MIAATLAEQKKAKFKFFAAYIFSVILILVVLSYLGWGRAPENNPAVLSAAPAKDESKHIQIDAVLHKSLGELEDAYAAFVTGSENSQESQAKIHTTEGLVKATLDSTEKVIAGIEDEEQRLGLKALWTNCKTTFDHRQGLMNRYMQLLNNTAQSVPSNTPSETAPATTGQDLQELKDMLIQKEEKIAILEKQRQSDIEAKDKTIAALQNQLNQKPSAPNQIPVTTGDSEWRQKHAKLKASYDNLVAENKALNQSYKTLIEDNRRLISQIQTIKKQ